MSGRALAGERLWYLDRLRAFACLAVVLIHCFSALLDNMPVSELGVARSVVWTELHVLLARWAVPVFFMTTGALLLDPSKGMGWGRIRGYVGRMAAVLLSFGTLFALMKIVFTERSIDALVIPRALLAVLQGESWDHLWYLFDLIGLYLLLPLLRSFVAQCGRGEIEVLLGILFVCSLVLPTANYALGLSLETFVWLGFPVFYALLGWYLREYEMPVVPVVALGVAGAAAAALAAGVGIVATGGYLWWSWEPSSPLIAAWAATVFVLARRFADRPTHAGGGIEALGKLSFAVYVLHPVVVNLLYKALGWGPAALPPVAFELTTYAIVLAGSLALALAARRVPVLGRCL